MKLRSTYKCEELELFCSIFAYTECMLLFFLMYSTDGEPQTTKSQ